MTNDFRFKLSSVNIRQLLYFLYTCYRHGVEDAAYNWEEEECHEYVKRMRSTHVYGIMGEKFDITWKEWVIRLVVYATKDRGFSYDLKKLFLEVDKYGSYESVFLRVAMDFYVNGVDDYSKYPVFDELARFLSSPTPFHWKKDFDNDFKMTYEDLMYDLNLIVYNRIRSDLDIKFNGRDGDTLAMSEHRYVSFLNALWLMYNFKFKGGSKLSDKKCLIRIRNYHGRRSR